MTDFRLEDEVRIPLPAMRALATAARRLGEPVAGAVREAGRATGEDITRRIGELVRLADLGTADFWAAVNAETGARGIGTFEWEGPDGGHAGLLVLDPSDAVVTEGGEPEALAAPFTEGFIEGLLSAVAQESVAVVQAPPDGSEGIRFVIGSPTALRHVRLRLSAGASLEQALEDL